MSDAHLLESLTPDRRMALGYAPRRFRALFAGFYALDARLGGIVLAAREPMLAQLKLAWWREQLAKEPAQRPRGEPLLGALDCWEGHGQDLSVLADGWEWMLADDPRQGDAVAGFAQARADGCAVLARAVGSDEQEAARAGYNWALADLAGLMGPGPGLKAAGAASNWSKPQLDRALRPLLIHHEQARLSKNNDFNGAGLTGFVTSIRLGLIGI